MNTDWRSTIRTLIVIVAGFTSVMSARAQDWEPRAIEIVQGEPVIAQRSVRPGMTRGGYQGSFMPPVIDVQAFVALDGDEQRRYLNGLQRSRTSGYEPMQEIAAMDVAQRVTLFNALSKQKPRDFDTRPSDVGAFGSEQTILPGRTAMTTPRYVVFDWDATRSVPFSSHPGTYMVVMLYTSPDRPYVTSERLSVTVKPPPGLMVAAAAEQFLAAARWPLDAEKAASLEAIAADPKAGPFTEHAEFYLAQYYLKTLAKDYDLQTPAAQIVKREAYQKSKSYALQLLRSKRTFYRQIGAYNLMQLQAAVHDLESMIEHAKKIINTYPGSLVSKLAADQAEHAAALMEMDK